MKPEKVQYTFDPDAKIYVCSTCQYSVNNKSKMTRHLSRITPCSLDETHKNLKHPQIASLEANRRCVIIFEDGDEPKGLVCKYCNKTFSKKDHYERHMNRQDPCVNTYSGIYRILKAKTPKNQLNVLDLFCGCGGFATGFVNAGYNVVAGIDFWKLAIKSYSQNFTHLSICENLTELSPELFVKKYNITDTIDVIIGGPPCQGFSTMGNRDPKDPRNSLFMEFVKYVYYFLPKAFVIENVVDILSMRTSTNEEVIDIILSYMNLSYYCKVFKLSASDYNVPQERKRVFIIGIRKNLDVEPTKPPFSSKYNKIPVKTVLLRESEVDDSHYLTKTHLDRIENGKNNSSGKVFGLKFIDVNKPCNTVLAGYGRSGGYTSLIKYSDYVIRRLTVLELKRIQTFPDDYILCGTDNEKIKQIGNAVPCNLAYHIGRHLRRSIKNRT